MNCVRPPLLKKPARGFAWSCGPCSRKQERKLEARNTPLVSDKALDGEEEELLDEEEEDHGGVSNAINGDSVRDSATQNAGPRPATAEQVSQAKLWPYRYLGIHCRVEDALDYDDRIYPRASSRLGPKHQANVHVWHGRPVELVKPADIRRKYMKAGSHKKDAKMTKETIAALEVEKTTREKRPKWVMDEPPGYVHRGGDHSDGDSKTTAKLQFRLPEVGEISSRGIDDTPKADGLDQPEELIDEYMARAKSLAKVIGVPDYSTNFLDKALELLCAHKYAIEPALEQLRHMNRRKDLKEPELTKEELKRFEEGVAKYGSELRNVSRHVGKPQKHGEIVRFYYMWKKTDRGKQIWGHYDGRKGKKQSKQVDSKLVDDVADDIDDSAFDNSKAAARKRGFECKFCASRKSSQWRRAPATAPGTTVPADPHSKSNKDKGAHLMLALCQRCAGLWRKYGIQWENIDEVAKKVANGGGRAWKRKIDEELLIELVSANEAHAMGMNTAAAATAAATVGVDAPSGQNLASGQDGPKKKQKLAPENQGPPAASSTHVEPPKKKTYEKPPEPPLIPETPRLKVLPCAVCNQMEPMGDQHLVCRHCRLTVHRSCYGVAEGRSGSKWTCDTCSNDSTSQVSTTYECVLCPVIRTEQELMEPPRISHKKKSDREREKERLEREMVIEATNLHRRRQIEQGRPFEPREPLKRTAGNNWVHVVCALWISDLRFASAKLLDSAEGIGSIPSAKYGQVCKVCKSERGVCVSCQQCAAFFHVTCAQQYGHTIGFELTPAKGFRKESANTVTLGSETGIMSAVIFCREHTVKTTVHPMHEMVDDSPLNALQLFARNYKQVDLTTTGTVRKAALIHSSARGVTHAVGPIVNSHRNSTSNTQSNTAGNSTSASTTRSSRVSPTAVTVKSEEFDEDGDRVVHLTETAVAVPVAKDCSRCGTDTSPKWHKTEPPIIKEPHSPSVAVSTGNAEARLQPPAATPNGHINGEATSSSTGATPAVQEPIVESSTGTYANPAENQDSGSKAVNHNGDAPAISASTEHETEAHLAMISAPTFVCHKCHLRKLRDPTPPRITSSPEDIQPMSDEILAPDSPPPTAQPVWPPVAPMPARDPYHGWPNQPGPRFGGRPRISNAVSRSPPAAPPPLQPHFVGHNGPYHMSGYGHSHSRHEQPMQHLTNGIPSPYQHARNHGGHLPSNPYPPRAGPPHSSRVHHGPPPPAMRSPPMHDNNIQGPHGPPRAAENPFAIPYQSRTPPRQQYHGIYGSPRENHERPETPPAGIGRNGVWLSSDGQMTNGASASPSLRNLLH